MSQVTIIGLPQPKSWDDYERGCLSTYGGGHRGDMYEAFQHGMSTVFNLLRAEFPPAEICKANAKLHAQNTALANAWGHLDVIEDCVKTAPDGWRKEQCLEAIAGIVEQIRLANQIGEEIKA